MTYTPEEFACGCRARLFTDLVPSDYRKLVDYGGEIFCIIGWCEDPLFAVVAAALRHGTLVQLPIVSLRRLIDNNPSNYKLVPIKSDTKLWRKFTRRRK